MKKFIFITEEGYTSQPYEEDVSLDIENMQVVGFGEGSTVEDALTNMLEEDEFLKETSFNEVTGIEITNEARPTLYLKTVNADTL